MLSRAAAQAGSSDDLVRLGLEDIAAAAGDYRASEAEGGHTIATPSQGRGALCVPAAAASAIIACIAHGARAVLHALSRW